MKFITATIVSLLGYHVTLADETTNRLGNLKGGRTLKGNKAGKAGKANAKACKGNKALSEPDPVLLQMLYNAGVNTDDFKKIINEEITVGSLTALIPEAADAGSNAALVKDGQSGDVGFPFGPLKPIATVGEYDTCSGEVVVGVPDGLGAYLADDDTVRLVVQSESYGPLRYESYPFPVNNGAASFTGSHVQYADYDRKMLSEFMTHSGPASDFLVGFGEMIETSYNLKGELVGPRSDSGATTTGAHYSNTDADGNYVLAGTPSRADWNMQSLCSAHMEERHQWGPGIGFENSIFLTNEEWNSYVPNVEKLVGLPVHAIDVVNKVDYAVGAITNGGFEKVVEINSLHSDYVIIAWSGYNGAFGSYPKVVENRNTVYGNRTDGNPWVKPENIHPYRIYVGKKGFKEDGTAAAPDDFLAKNGLKYGKIYGFAIDMTSAGPTGGLWRDEFHRSSSATNGAKVSGYFMPANWQWDGTVKDFIHDGSWDFQDAVPNGPTGYQFWNGKGNDSSGCKTEHLSPDPRSGKSAFIQSSTCGYFGHVYLTNILSELQATGDFPASIAAEYYVYNGELDIVNQINLGGKGQYADGKDATRNYSSSRSDTGYTTFEDIDGFEVLEGPNGELRAIIQEDSGNVYGERMFITSPLEHEADGKDLTYYFMAMSGGSRNTRMKENVGVPSGTSAGGGSHEFSGIFDLSGLLAMHGSNWMKKAADPGHVKRSGDKMTPFHEKLVLLGLQAHNLRKGVIETFQADRGGQWLIYQPKNV